MIEKTSTLNLLLRRVLEPALEAFLGRHCSLTGAVFAGGFIRDTLAGDEPRDLDIFFNSEKLATHAVASLVAGGWTVTHTVGRVVTLEKDVKIAQVITWPFGTPEDLIAKFDFTVCAVAAWYDGLLRGAADENFSLDLVLRRLRVLALPCPEKSLKRATRLSARGWDLDEYTLAEIEYAIAAAQAARSVKTTDATEDEDDEYPDVVAKPSFAPRKVAA